MFKIGQKVVFVGLNPNTVEFPTRHPSVNEICTISGYGLTKGFYLLLGYEEFIDGWQYVYDETELRPLDESFAEEVLEMIKEQINEEELITV